MNYKIDPELVAFAASAPSLESSDPMQARATLEAMTAVLNAEVDVTGLNIEDITIAGPDRAPHVKARVYAPPLEADRQVPGLLYIHGGGFFLGSVDTEHAAAALLARELQIVLLSVDYRLAPENPYPAGLEDCYQALCWLKENARELHVDPARIAVFGQSAGGGLSAALAILSRDRGGPALCFQYLGIPELDDRLETFSTREFVDSPMWNRPLAVQSWKYYLGNLAGGDVPIYAAPARASVEQLRNLPPAYINAMEFDPLRDEDIAYAVKLMQAGVQVELHTFPGTFHGSSAMSTAAISQRQQEEMLAVLRRGLSIGKAQHG